MSEVLLTNASVVAGLMLAVWVVSIPLRNVSIVDLAWGFGFVCIAWVSVLVASTDSVTAGWTERPSMCLLPLCTTLWGLRLTGYLAWRNHGRPEDKRYAAMRARRGNAFWWQSLFVVFLLQGVVMWVVSLPVQVGVAQAESGWAWVHAIGLVLWSVGLFFETVGDWQLARFKAQPENRGQVMDRGLWRYTRHPNYFGDFCVWWGLYALAAAHGASVWTVVSPLLMSIFLLRVSGVTLLEQSLREEKPDYAEYVRRTNAFVPWFPRS